MSISYHKTAYTTSRRRRRAASAPKTHTLSPAHASTATANHAQNGSRLELRRARAAPDDATSSGGGGGGGGDGAGEGGGGDGVGVAHVALVHTPPSTTAVKALGLVRPTDAWVVPAQRAESSDADTHTKPAPTARRETVTDGDIGGMETAAEGYTVVVPRLASPPSSPRHRAELSARARDLLADLSDDDDDDDDDMAAAAALARLIVQEGVAPGACQTSEGGEY